MFVRIVDGAQELMQARLRDGAVRPLTRTPEREESWPYWSEPARRLVFQVAARDAAGRLGRSDLVLLDPDTGDEKPVRVSPTRDERWPTWSSDGWRLAYAFRGGSPAAGIAVLDLTDDSLRLRARSDERRLFRRPQFAPDGLTLVAERAGWRAGSAGLWIVPEGARLRQLTRDPHWVDSKACFSRDGERVLFSRLPADGGPRDIASVARDGSDLRVLASTPESDDHSARPSPARDEIVFVSDRSGDADLYLADLDGKGVRAILRSPERSELAPRWSPDGELLVVTASPSGRPEPRLDDREGLAALRVVVLDRAGRVRFDEPGMMADWMSPWP